MNKINYQTELERIISQLSHKSRVPRLLLHSCCAPCSSYVLEYLSEYFQITVFYYNPNIFPMEEHEMRAQEQKKLIQEMKTKHQVQLLVGKYEPERFYNLVKGMEQEPEGGLRCERCFRLRLEETAALAKQLKFDYFATTLTISPLKHALVLNEIGEQLGSIYKVAHLPSDFKKKNGYKRSVELSSAYNLYRQSYCGCIYSKKVEDGAVVLDTCSDL